MKELIATVLVLIMFFCLLVEAGAYVFVKNPSTNRKRVYDFFDKIYCLCLFLICALVVLISIVRGS